MKRTLRSGRMRKTLRRTMGVLVLLLALAVMANAAVAAQVELRLLACGGFVDDMRAVVERFSEVRPDINVVIEDALICWTALEERMLVGHLGGAAPDLALWQDETFANFAEQGVLANLDPFIEKDPIVQEELEYYLKPALEAYQYDPETRTVNRGSIYGLSIGGGEVLAFYNADLFERKGLAPPADDWTCDEFLSMNMHLTEFNNAGDVVQYGTSFNGWWLYTWMPLVWSNGGDFFNEPTRDHSVFRSPQTIEALTFLHDLYHQYQVATAEAPPFLQGWAGFRVDGPWYVSAVESAEGNFEWGVASFPPVKAGAEYQQSRVTFDGIVMSATTEHPEEAWAFIRFVVAEEGRDILAARGRLIPASSRAFDASPWADPSSPRHHFVRLMHLARIQPIILEWVQVDRELTRLNDQLVWQRRSPIEVVEEAHQILDRAARESHRR